MLVARRSECLVHPFRTDRHGDPSDWQKRVACPWIARPSSPSPSPFARQKGNAHVRTFLSHRRSRCTHPTCVRPCNRSRTSDLRMAAVSLRIGYRIVDLPFGKGQIWVQRSGSTRRSTPRPRGEFPGTLRIFSTLQSSALPTELCKGGARASHKLTVSGVESAWD